MHRRHFLSLLPGFVCLTAARSAEPTISVVFLEAPTRTALEMLFKAFGQKNYLIDNHVIGLVSLRTETKSLDINLNRICRANLAPLTATTANQVSIVKPTEPSAREVLVEQLQARFAGARFPLVAGVPIRMAGAALGSDAQGAVAYAILEQGLPPNSSVEITTVGSEVSLGTSKARVVCISLDEVVLDADGTRHTVPLSPLVAKARRTRA